MTENGRIIKHKVKEYTQILKVLNMKVNGKTINNMDLVLRNFQMELSTKEITPILVNQEMVNTIGRTAQLTMENGLKTRFMDWESISGLMVENIMVTGQKVK